MPVVGEGRGDELRLLRRDDLVVEALEDEDGHGDRIDGMDRRSLAVQAHRLGIRAEQARVVVRLELVGVLLEELEVGDTEQADAGREEVAEGERRERRVAAGAAALDGQPIRVDVAPLDEEPGGRDGVVDVDDTPLPFEPTPVVAAVAGAAAVVDVDDRDPAAGQELLREIEGRTGIATSGRRGSGRRAAASPPRARRRPGSWAGNRARTRSGHRSSGTRSIRASRWPPGRWRPCSRGAGPQPGRGSAGRTAR